MDEAYVKRYRDLFERHWWWRARRKAILKTLTRLQPPQGWKFILDVGCGDGLFFEDLAKFGEVEGVEPDRTVVTPNGPHSARIHVQPFDESFQLGKRYDLILMLDVLEHLENPTPALRHALGLLEPMGAVLITVPAFNQLWTNHDTLNEHFRRYTKSTFGALARESGLAIESQQYLFQWLCPLKLATTLIERAFDLQPAVPAIPPAVINEPLYLLARLEQETLSRLPCPFGSSLLIVGRKPA